MWVERDRAVLRVTTRDDPAGLSRAFEPDVLARAAYAVALAAAEMLDLLRVTAQPRGPVNDAATSDAPRDTGGAPSTPNPAAPAGERPASAAAAAVVPRAPPAPLPAAQATPAADDARAASTAARVSIPPTQRAAEPERKVTPEAAAVAAPPQELSARPSAPLGFALGIDLELQAQPGPARSSLRPALYAELAVGRGTSGWFWTAGARVAAPLAARDLEPVTDVPITGSRVRAWATDAALVGGLGHSLGRLGLAAHVAAGTSYSRVEALDRAGRVLGRDANFAPLVGAGLGARLPVILGLALAVEVEAQWAGPRTTYRIEGAPALVGDPFRLGFLTGIVWESALSGAP